MATLVCRLGEIALITRRSQVQIVFFEPRTRSVEPEGRGSGAARESWICSIDLGAELSLFGALLTKG